ncbi:alpha-hydroxy-acid oxidizing protein [Nakamurella sp. YIM 132087]|uniref:Alpha-hydroxy-acid oxidizing protein n=1 Tax=Nakamurella alba TaxID=2665158 RepID=A0A7K1FE55_9ACTN|nr:alpha-hydroxy acid oxidase [Nakamurella alba]MTD12385.1 alpha-hydroxy-acid oxidizing protein [Nakamurella alba]
MDLAMLLRSATELLPADVLHYLQATAGPDSDADEKAWQSVALVPRVLQGVDPVDTRTSLAGRSWATPIHVSATAAHGLYHPEAEVATARAARKAGALFCYSSSATLEVTAFAAAAGGPFWAQVYVMTDRGRTRDYLARCVAGGAEALVLTVDNPGRIGDPPFRTVTSGFDVRPGNYPGWDWPTMSAHITAALTPASIGELATESGLPVWVKGVLDPRDAAAAVDAGATGIIVSNHGRRQLAGVVTVAVVLPGIVDAVGGEVPVLVDGGIRSGTDVLRALTLGATGVGIGRPALWALAVGGPTGVTTLLDDLTADLRRGMAGLGAGTIDGIRDHRSP